MSFVVVLEGQKNQQKGLDSGGFYLLLDSSPPVNLSTPTSTTLLQIVSSTQ